MQAMPVLDAILAGRPVNHCVDGQIRETYVSDADLGKMFRVKCDEAAELYWHDVKGRLDPRKDFGPLRLPGSHVWIEAKNPNRGYAEGEWRDLEPMSFAISIRETPMKNGNFKLFAFPYLITPGGDYVAALEVGESMVVDPAGQVVDGTFAVGVPEYIDRRKAHAFIESHGEDHMHSVAQVCRIGWIAVGLMNCKNITSTESDKAGPRRKKSKGKKFPKLTYRTINIPGYQARRFSSKSNAAGVENAVHRVRGHFKTFTAERPLMGRHVGTYWWGWQVRGNAQNGAIISDYKVTKTAA